MPQNKAIEPNYRNSNLDGVDGLILCGGRGERLRPLISDRPKPLAPLGERVFLDILIEHLIAHGICRIILSIGYLKDHIKDRFENYYERYSKPFKIEFSEEDTPLGTGGAVKKAQGFILSDHFLVLNGDSFCPVDLFDFYNSHLERGALVSIVLSEMEDARDYGSVGIDNENRITHFHEKESNKKSNLVNAGLYFMRKEVFDLMPGGDPFSLEYDFFPRVLGSYCHGYVTNHQFIDIGTPERYLKATQLFDQSRKSF